MVCEICENEAFLAQKAEPARRTILAWHRICWTR